MALIKCDECGHKISDKSIACPNCGYPTHLNKALAAAKTKPEPKSEPEIAPAQAENPKQESSATPEPSSEKSPLSETESTVTKQAVSDIDPLADYEASLSHPDTPETNERKKLWFYIGFFITLLLIVCALYYYAKANPATDGEEAEPNEVTEQLTIPSSADSISDTMPLNISTEQKPTRKIAPTQSSTLTPKPVQEPKAVKSEPQEPAEPSSVPVETPSPEIVEPAAIPAATE